MPSEQVDPTQVEALIEAIGRLDPSALNKEVIRSMGDIVGFDKDDTMGQPFTTREEDSQFTVLYNSYTGEASRVTVTMLPRLLTRKFGPQHVEVPPTYWGKRVWTATRPIVDRGPVYPCIFGPESPERADVVAAGFGHINCRKSNIPNESERRLHADHTHRSGWRGYREYMERKQAAEDRAVQIEMLKVIGGLAAKANKV